MTAAVASSAAISETNEVLCRRIDLIDRGQRESDAPEATIETSRMRGAIYPKNNPRIQHANTARRVQTHLD